MASAVQHEKRQSSSASPSTAGTSPTGSSTFIGSGSSTPTSNLSPSSTAATNTNTYPSLTTSDSTPTSPTFSIISQSMSSSISVTESSTPTTSAEQSSAQTSSPATSAPAPSAAESSSAASVSVGSMSESAPASSPTESATTSAAMSTTPSASPSDHASSQPSFQVSSSESSESSTVSSTPASTPSQTPSSTPPSSTPSTTPSSPPPSSAPSSTPSSQPSSPSPSSTPQPTSTPSSTPPPSASPSPSSSLTRQSLSAPSPSPSSTPSPSSSLLPSPSSSANGSSQAVSSPPTSSSSGSRTSVSAAGNVATTTFKSTVWITTTNSQGQTVTSAPPLITETLTTTGSNGPSVVTIIAGNPEPISDGGGTSNTSQFFRNKGAVAGVFLIVGLAAASILLFLFFFIRRRRRTRRLEHDTAVASTLAAVGFNRTPLDGDDEDDAPHTRQRQSSALSYGRETMSSVPSGSGGGRPPSGYLDDPAAGPSDTPRDTEFDPYAAYGTIHPPPPASLGFSRKDGYVPARTSSPPPAGAWVGGHTHSYSMRSDSTSSGGLGHIPRESASSHDLLLSGYPPLSAGGAGASTPSMPPTILNSSSGDIFSPPPRNPQRLVDSGQISSREDVGEPPGGLGVDRPRGSATSSMYSMAEDEGPFEDPTESRPALEVRNLPDGVTCGDISREPSRRE
ncbi:hypothetical protein AcV7_000670 [Taiwanofungus camphoratus]|nr:hypothetical protein AcW2_000851 [Antrodia cinnamomea]KAI0961611.1 hypothetical protein AcV7_000670 [Antrodia cinnamomea]